MLATLKVSFSDIVNSDIHCQIPGKSWIWPNMSKFLLSVQRLFQVAMVTVVDDIICYKAYCMSASVVIIKPPTYSSCSNFGTSHKFCPHCRSAWKRKPMNAQANVHGLLVDVTHSYSLWGWGKCINVFTHSYTSC